MPTRTVFISSNQSATAVPLVEAGSGPMLLQNAGPDDIWIGDSYSIQPNDPNTTVKFGNGTSITVSGENDVWAVAIPGFATVVNVIAGGQNFFNPPSLAGLGGIKLFVQATAPTQPPTIPVNSIWFNTTPPVSLNYWSGSAWITQAFAGSQLISAGTVIANLMAAGIVIGGIVDGTTIQAAQFIGGNYFGYSTPNPAQDTLTISFVPGAASVNDSAGNTALSGITSYGGTANKWLAMNVSQGGLLQWFESVAAHMNTWSLLGQLAPGVGNPVSLNNGGNGLLLGASTDFAEIAQSLQMAWQNSTPGGPIGGQCSGIWGQGNLGSPQLVLEGDVFTGNTSFPAAPATCNFGLNTASINCLASGGPFVPGESFHNISLGSGLTGTLRVKLLPWNMVHLNGELTWSGTAGTTITCGSLPGASYYPVSARHWPVGFTGIPTAVTSAPRLFLSTSGGLQIILPTVSAANAAIGFDIVYPNN